MVILPGAYGIQSPNGMDVCCTRSALCIFDREPLQNVEAKKKPYCFEGLLWDLWDNAQMNTIDVTHGKR
jgi:hypothetical protein